MRICPEHENPYTGCVACQEDMAEEIEVLRSTIKSMYKLIVKIKLDIYQESCYSGWTNFADDFLLKAKKMVKGK